MAYSSCRCISRSHGRHGQLILLCVISFFAISAGSRFLSLPVGLVSLGSAVSPLPPVVPHDGVRVLVPFDAADLACTPGPGGPSKAAQAKISSAVAPKASFLESARSAAAKKARHLRRKFICDAGCSAREPELEVSLSQWADWKQNSSGLEMIDALEGFCNTQRNPSDPFIMTVLWQGEVYFKPCGKDVELSSVGLYLIGPEDLSLAMVFLLGVQKVAPLPAGPIAFGMYLSDYTSLLDHHLIGPGVPIFAYLGRDTSWVIPFPSTFTVISTQETEAWQKSQDENRTQKVWEDRDDRAYWIGAVTGPWDFQLDDALLAVPRLKMLKMANDHPQDLLAEWSSAARYGISWVKTDHNVSGFLAPNSGSRSIQELTGIGPAKYKRIGEWQDFKYYVNLDGVVLGGRFNKLLSLGGVVLQHQAGYKEHISALAKPYEHYVPIEYDLSDLVEKVHWLQNNDAEAKRIAANGKALADKRMRFEDHVCYVWRALEGLGAKAASAPVNNDEVQLRLKDFKKATAHESGMRKTMEAFWGTKMEDIATGNRKMTARGIQLLDWAWDRMEGLYDKTHSRA